MLFLELYLLADVDCRRGRRLSVLYFCLCLIPTWPLQQLLSSNCAKPTFFALDSKFLHAQRAGDGVHPTTHFRDNFAKTTFALDSKFLHAQRTVDDVQSGGGALPGITAPPPHPAHFCFKLCKDNFCLGFLVPPCTDSWR
jgi:hypothetical protein